MNYRKLFATLDTIATKLTLAEAEIEIALSEIKYIKSELWNHHYNNADKKVMKVKK